MQGHVYRGHWTVSVSKGVVELPEPFKARCFFVAVDPTRPCLLIYPSPPQQDHAIARMNNSGRLKIDKTYLDMAGITEQAEIAGMGDHLALWDPQRHNNYLEKLPPVEELAAKLGL